MKTKQRKNELGEVFTPLPLVNEILDKLSSFSDEAFTKPNKTFLDPSCGNGNFLIEVLKRKLQTKHSPKKALSTIYGVDIMVDNVCDTIVRLASYAKWNIDIFNNIDLTEDGGYNQEDYPTFDWLKENHTWTRVYTFGSHKVQIRPNQERWWLFEYSLNGKDYTICQNIICADALRYHFRFDGEHPYEDENQKRKKDLQQMDFFGEVL